MRKFAICFHHTYEDIKVWREFAEYLENHINEKIELITYSSINEERVRSLKEDYDLVFQNPETTFTFIKKGYRPIARLNNQWDTVYYIARKNLQRNLPIYNVGIVPLKVIYSSLLELSNIGFDLNRINFKMMSNLNEIHESLFLGEIDIGITRKDTFSRMPGNFKDSVQILIEFGMGIFHSFLLKDENSIFGEKIKQILFTMHNNSEGIEILNKLGSDQIVGIGYELYFLERLTQLGEKIFQFRDYKSFFDAVQEVEEIGIIIYDEKIKYANKYALRLLGYDELEIKNINMTELFPKRRRNIVLDHIKRRISGEFFNSKYDHMKLFNKDKDAVHVTGFASTIVFQGEYSGLFIFVDSREKVITEKLYNSSKEINKIVLYSNDESDVGKKLCEVIVDRLGFDYVKVCLQDNDYVVCFENGSPLIKSDKVYDLSLKKMTVKKIMKRKDIIKGLIFKLPILINNEIVAIVEIHTSKYIEFEERLREFMKTLRDDISFVILKIRKNFEARAYLQAIKSAKELFFITNKHGKIKYWNNALCEIMGYKDEEILESTPRIFKSGVHSKSFYENFYKTITSGQEFNGVFINRAKNGNLVYLDTTVIPIKKGKTIKGFVSIGKDITNEIALKEMMESLKYKDHITDCFNRVGLIRRIDELISNNSSLVSAFILLDVNNMSYFNDKFGYDFGNLLLKEIANVIRNGIRERDIFGRVGGDDFGIFFFNIREEHNVFRIVEKLQKLMSSPISIGDKKVKPIMKMSVVLYPRDSKSAKELLNKGYIALSSVDLAKNNIVFYDQQMAKKAEEYIHMDDLISWALKEDRFELYYQPCFFTNPFQLAGFEALVRIKDQNNKLIYPVEFIDFLERSIYLDQFESWLIQKAIKFVEETNYNIAINLSAKNLGFRTFIDNISKIPFTIGNKITIEITERELNENISFFMKEIIPLKEKIGFKLAIDDFGTGYSSLLRLKEMPLDMLKIDINFIRGMLSNEKDRSLVSVMLDIGKRFNYLTLAEGVETEEQFNFLKENGCDYVQGYLFAKPIDYKEVINTNWDK